MVDVERDLFDFFRDTRVFELSSDRVYVSALGVDRVNSLVDVPDPNRGVETARYQMLRCAFQDADGSIVTDQF